MLSKVKEIIDWQNSYLTLEEKKQYPLLQRTINAVKEIYQANGVNVKSFAFVHSRKIFLTVNGETIVL